MICRKKTLNKLLWMAMLAFSCESLWAQKIGEPLPLWQEGWLDIHHISTGKGESAFFMLPDGTTLLVDAGVQTRPKSPKEATAKPDESRAPGEWIARYVLHMLQQRGEKVLDYAVLTHFDGDHMGGVLPDMPRAQDGGYLLSGITEVPEFIPIRKIIDRGWPDYNWPKPLVQAHVLNYRKFLDWQTVNKALEIERFEAGTTRQLSLLNRPSAYPNFEIRNLVVNGEAWTGLGDDTENHFPAVETLSEHLPTENMSSVAFRMTYGKFDYFTGGDLLGVPYPGNPSWYDIETPVAKVTGPVDVCVLNHHGHYDSSNDFFLATLKPSVQIIQSWDYLHPASETLNRMLSTEIYPGKRDIFATNIIDLTREMVGPPINELKSQQGHIVVRVAEGGEAYTVYILDDAAESFVVKAIHGPYQSR
jgi:beta-lactamase superfamily II metal-dependent hydrolase